MLDKGEVINQRVLTQIGLSSRATMDMGKNCSLLEREELKEAFLCDKYQLDKKYQHLKVLQQTSETQHEEKEEEIDIDKKLLQ